MVGEFDMDVFVSLTQWCFSYDEDSIFRELKDNLSYDIGVVYKLEEFNFLPTFIPLEIQKKFNDGFRKNYCISIIK
ncbi:trehalose-phosphatase/synthase, putative [Medicago truncatula]|uniref:Trehalose-phosphatase/synthase, putative n=1 Tax=Medicago truncatula TaxID=3880 RepID=G7KPT6_MEDTR|nr:trehalose-phosphatase/synthase, putative [Medicago truncatula]